MGMVPPHNQKNLCHNTMYAPIVSIICRQKTVSGRMTFALASRINEAVVSNAAEMSHRAEVIGRRQRKEAEKFETRLRLFYKQDHVFCLNFFRSSVVFFNPLKQYGILQGKPI